MNIVQDDDNQFQIEQDFHNSSDKCRCRLSNDLLSWI